MTASAPTLFILNVDKFPKEEDTEEKQEFSFDLMYDNQGSTLITWEPGNLVPRKHFPCRKLGANFCSFKGNVWHDEYLIEGRSQSVDTKCYQWKCLSTMKYNQTYFIK